MKFTNLLTAGALATALVSPSVLHADTTLTDAQKKDIQKVVHDYLVSNPEVLLEASQALQQKQQQTMQQQAQSAIQEQAAHLFSDKFTVTGNPKGNVTLVEFFDYQCIHCKKMTPVIADLIAKNSNLRVIYKEFPIFGKSSDLASKVAIAAAMQGKYIPMHDALLKVDKRLTDELVMEAAKSVGLDVAKLKTDMDSKAVSEILDANRALAEKLHLMGTPAFVIASTPGGEFKAGSETFFIPGAATAETLQEMIKKSGIS
jgi:protein-disulfide isomerase